MWLSQHDGALNVADGVPPLTHPVSMTGRMILLFKLKNLNNMFITQKYCYQHYAITNFGIELNTKVMG
jgi:hypothetical protein